VVRRLAIVAALFAFAAPAQAAVFTVRGHGWGHGVGMSQWGARGLALHGWSWRGILSHYYPGTDLSRVAHVKVRVLIRQRRDGVAFSARTPFRIVDARGRSRLQRRRIVFRTGAWHGLRPPLRLVAGAEPVAVDGAGYRGSFVVRRGIDVVNVVPLERYLCGVVSWEMPKRWPAEALRAQAVAARTYTVENLAAGSWFDVYPDTRDQMYGGIRAEDAATNRAVGATAGRILTWHGAPAKTFYFSTSGGRTQSSQDAFHGSAIPYLRSVADPYDAGPKHDWTYRFTALQIARRLHVPLPHSLSVRLNPSGWVASVVVGSRTINGVEFERALGLPSTHFRVGPRAPQRTGVHVRTRPRAGWVAVLETSASRFRGSVSTSSLHGLRPGLWVRIKGPFASRATAVVAAGSSGYVRRVVRG
jgi:stage II sporulation protein D